MHLELRGLVAVHAARAAHTALAAVPGLLSANVTMSGAEVHLSGPYDPETFANAVRAALEPIGVELIAVRVVQQRVLPMA